VTDHDAESSKRVDNRSKADRLLTTAEAAAILEVTRATVVAWGRAGRLGEVIQYGPQGHYRFPRRAILVYRDAARAAVAPDRDDPDPVGP